MLGYPFYEVYSLFLLGKKLWNGKVGLRYVYV